jgi:hypothetical protein
LIPDVRPLPLVVALGTTADATVEAGEPRSPCFCNGGSVWYLGTRDSAPSRSGFAQVLVT